MKYKLFYSCLLLNLFINIQNNFGQEKRICITVDDLPVVTYEKNDPALNKKITNNLIHTFNHYKIPVIGFVNEVKLFKDGEIDSSQVELLKMWLKNGFDLGNHTYSHLDYNKVSESVYFEDVLKGGIVTEKLLKQNGKSLRYFRHPYLYTGIDSDKANSLTKFLITHHYEVSPVTIETEDYVFAKAYHIAMIENNTTLMEEIGNSYLQYMEKILEYFEIKSEEVFHKPITQTLLIHASLLNSEYLAELVKMYQRHGYNFVSQKKALTDPIYKLPVTVHKPDGTSWIFKWAFSKGMSEDIMKDKPLPPSFVVKLVHSKE